LFAAEAAKRWAPDGITVNALTPGRIATRLTRYLDQVEPAPGAFEGGSPSIRWKTVEQGAASSVLLAASPLLDGVTGRYFEDGNEAGPARPGIRRGVAAYALDPANAARLWPARPVTAPAGLRRPARPGRRLLRGPGAGPTMRASRGGRMGHR